ncbi:MAG TPA: DNA repair helicase XPB [Terriglobales bacterium]|nr:DNA repair helicase XPB [Terriglobales bacterium]
MPATVRYENPLIVQSDLTVLVEVDSPGYSEGRDALARFAELVKSPEHVHTYRITPLSIWNARAAGVTTEWIREKLRGLSKYDVPRHVEIEIAEYAARYGRLKLMRDHRGLVLSISSPALAEELVRHQTVVSLLGRRIEPQEFLVEPSERGRLKQALIKVGYPVEDLAGYLAGEQLEIILRQETRGGLRFRLRDYQREAAEIFYAAGTSRGGSAVIVLPCGAGKTIVGLACMALLQTSTVVLTTSVTAARQWIAELIDKTTVPEEAIGEYSGHRKDIRPVTIATYNILTWRADKAGRFEHLELFDEREWGLIVYDEVHLLPAPVFQVTAGLQARRRLGLTATLVREDGREDDVFALIGPKKVDMPWKELERQGWIASARCHEVRVAMPETMRMDYAVASPRDRFRIASENPLKKDIVRQILAYHPEAQTLIIGMYVEQLRELADEIGIPLLTGTTRQARRDELFSEFKAGRIHRLAVSKVANFAVDLPDASVAIQVSGTFGSRQEEAQRLGRILRPKPGENQAHFYTLVSQDTVEQDFALKRQLFLCEQGYQYEIHDIEEMRQRRLADESCPKLPFPTGDAAQ